MYLIDFEIIFKQAKILKEFDILATSYFSLRLI